MAESTTVHRLPDGESPFGTGPVLTVVLPEAVTTLLGNVSAPAGVYEAQQQAHDAREGDITIWSEHHYTGRGLWVCVPAYDWHFPGEEPRPIPAHNCHDHLRTAVCGPDLYCGLCQALIF